MVPDSRIASAPSLGQSRQWRSLVLGVLVMVTGTTLAYIANSVFGRIGVFTWAVLMGLVVANTRSAPLTATPAFAGITRRLLRFGVVLLGFSLPIAAVIDLGWPIVGMVVLTVALTLIRRRGWELGSVSASHAAC
jgi:uncharacterized membrane protein YadS